MKKICLIKFLENKIQKFHTRKYLTKVKIFLYLPFIHLNYFLEGKTIKKNRIKQNFINFNDNKNDVH